MSGSTILRILTLGLCGRSTTPVGEQQAEENLSIDVGEQASQQDVKQEESCRLTEEEKSYLTSCRNVQEAKRLLTLGQERASALQYLNDFGQDTNIEEAILELKEGHQFRKKLKDNNATSFEQALDIAADPVEVYTLLSMASKSAIRKYASIEWNNNRGGYYYKSPVDGKDFHIETASPYTLHEHLILFRKQYGEIKKLAGIK